MDTVAWITSAGALGAGGRTTMHYLTVQLPSNPRPLAAANGRADAVDGLLPRF